MLSPGSVKESEAGKSCGKPSSEPSSVPAVLQRFSSNPKDHIYIYIYIYIPAAPYIHIHIYTQIRGHDIYKYICIYTGFVEPPELLGPAL